MSDDADRADEGIEMMLAAARLRRMPTLPAVGCCYNCEEPLSAGVFCDRDCEVDYMKRRKAREGQS